MLLLFIIFCLSLAYGHGEQQNRTTRSAAAQASVFRMSVWHVYDDHSPLRPKECQTGEAGASCVSAHHWQRLFNSTMDKPTTNNSKVVADEHGRVLSTAWADVSNERLGGRTFDYYAVLSVGTPPQPQLMILDTGSDLSWIQCKPCAPCYPQALPVFDGRRSSTGRPQTIQDPFCQAVQQTALGNGADAASCQYRTIYQDGTSSKGGLAFDDIHFWDLDENPSDYLTLASMAFGCGTSNFLTAKTLTSGTLGLAKSQGFSIPEQLVSTLGADFSYCLAPTQAPPNSGFIYLGVGAIPPSPYLYTNFVANANLWYINIIDIIVGGSYLLLPTGTLDFDPTTGMGGTFIDTGALISRITGAAYIPFRNAWRSVLRPLLGDPGPGFGELDTCYDYPNDVDLPLISFFFKDGNIFTPRNIANMFIYTSNSGHRRMCWPYLPTPSGFFASFVLGASAQISTQMIFDAQNQRLGWIYDVC